MNMIHSRQFYGFEIATIGVIVGVTGIIISKAGSIEFGNGIIKTGISLFVIGAALQYIAMLLRESIWFRLLSLALFVFFIFFYVRS